MKFTDGYWRIKEGNTIQNATEIRDVTPADSGVTVYAACRVVEHRGQTFNEPLITVEYSSPMENVIHVRAYHHKGGNARGPGFAVQNLRPDTTVQESSSALEYRSGDLRVLIPKSGDWDVRYFYRDKYLTGTGYKSTAYIRDEKKQPFLREQLHLGVGALVYGLGERFTALCRNGQTVDMWNDDGGTCSELAYKNVPFYLTNCGYGVLVNHPERVSFEVATENVSRVQFSVPGEYIDYYLIGGDSMRAVLQRYTLLTGRPALPPAWSFGLWISTSATPDQSEEIVRRNTAKMKRLDIPFSVYYLCCFWMEEYQFCSFRWNGKTYPDPQKMIADLHAQGIRICLWTNPFIAQKSPLFDEGKERGYFLRTQDGSVWQWDRWQNGMAVVDFTNPDAALWYQSYIKKLLDMGVDSVKMDFGERIPEDVVYFDGSDPQKMHNYYAYLYQKTVFEVLEREKGRNQAVSFSRAGTAGCQKFPVHWGGDNSSSYDSMAETLRAGLSLSLCGFGFWSHDISGFEKYPTPDLYKRWTAFGLLSSHSRIHGNNSLRLPWLFDEECVDVIRFFTKLKYRLMPYLYAAACETTETGIPVMRPMTLEFEEDPTCAALDRQYMLGEALLIAPVFREDGAVTYYLPAGRWTNFLTGACVEGGGWQTETHGYKSLPVMVKPASIIAVGPESGKPDYDYPANVVLHVFELGDGAQASCTLYRVNGTKAYTVQIQRTGNTVTAECSESVGGWSLLMRGMRHVTEVQGACEQSQPQGIHLQPHPQSRHITFVVASGEGEAL